MFMGGKGLVAGAVLVVACGAGCNANAPNESSDFQQDTLISSVTVVTQHNDLNRTGANLLETTLTTSNVAGGTFGKLFARTVDGQIYAQPLYVGGGIGTHNVVYAATEHNSVYAFDADDASASAPLWQVNLGTPVPSADMTGCVDLTPEVGITGTPVIDPVSKTLYVAAKTKVSGAYFYALHALDSTTGAERPGSPVTLTGTVTVGGTTVSFDPFRQHNRAGLTLVNGVVHVAFASHCDGGTYHGWVLSYNATTLAPVSQWVSTPTGSLGGIWMAGEGLGADPDGSLYFLTGNGTSDTSAGVNLGMAAVKLKPDASGKLSTSSWFIPWNQSSLNGGDLDLGSGGALLIPGTRLLVGGGKEGVLYLLNRDTMGGYKSTLAAETEERWSASGSSRIASSPVYWAGPTGGRIYVWPQSAPLRSFGFNGSTFEQTGTSGTVPSGGGFPGGALAISANGATHGSGVLWATRPNMDANHSVQPGTLYALDAEDITHVLWTSNDNGTRDTIPQYAKFSPPTIANGKVYLGTFANALYVYGLGVTGGTGGSGGGGSGGAGGGGAGGGSGSAGSAGSAGTGGAQPTDWTYVYNTYFAGTTAADSPGHCAECHGSPTSYLGGMFFGSDKASFYTNWVRVGLINSANPTASRIGDPATSPLAWFGTVGNMPADLGVPNAAAAAAVRGWVLAGALPGDEAPYGGTAAPIPGTLLASNYDTGGEGVAYHDNEAANLGGVGYRPGDGVDIEGALPSYAVDHTNPGEYLNFTVNVQTAGSYNISASVAAAAAGSSFHLGLGTATLATFAVPNTGALTTYQTVTVSNVTLSAGPQVLQLFDNTGGFNVRSLLFALTPKSTPFSGTAVPLPGTVFAYNYDNGGEGVAYHDTDIANLGGAGRATEGVDVEGAPTDVGWTAAGEWLNYSVNPAAGTYDITASVAATAAGSSFHLMAGTLNLGTFTVPNTGAWTTFVNVTLANVPLSAGQQILTLVEDTGGFNVASLGFVNTTHFCTVPADCNDGNPCTVDACSSGVCSNLAGNPGGVCRPSAGACDVAETCTGASSACPADAFVASTVVCRAAAGVCDQAETCTGSSALCPADALKASGTVCRAAASSCDSTETCSGLSTACPSDVSVPNGTACNDGNASTCSDVCSAGVCGGTTCTSNAYGGTPRSITSTIQGEDYDIGGEGSGYHDSEPANQGASYRTDGVDVQACTDTGGGFNVGWTLAGEWLNYSVTVPAAGSYKVNLRVAAMAAGQTMHLELDGANVTGVISVPNTGAWQTYQTVSQAIKAYLPAGNHVLRVVFDTIGATNGGINLNWLSFVATPGAYGGTVRGLVSTIQGEDFDLGGEGVGYHDLEAANQGLSYRTADGVDIQSTTDASGGFNVGWITAGEWLVYTTNSASTRSYTVNLRVASLAAQTLHVEVDGVNVSGAIAIPNTAAWQTFTTVSKVLTGNVAAGNHLVRVVFDTGGVNLNWLSFN